MIIRRYTKEDQENLVQVWFDSTLIAHSFIPKEKWESHKEDLRQEYLPNAETWIVEESGHLIGFISLLENYVGALFVHPAWQGKGIGTHLINHVKEIRENLKVGVYKKNRDAQRFYQKNGFRYDNEEIQKETEEMVINMIWI